MAKPGTLAERRRDGRLRTLAVPAPGRAELEQGRSGQGLDLGASGGIGEEIGGVAHGESSDGDGPAFCAIVSAMTGLGTLRPACSNPRMRQPAADSAKFVLVALVVIGHLIEACRSGYPQLEAAYRFLYLFHVPALAYVSGLFARAEFGVRDGQRWLATLILPLLVFQLIYLGFIAAISDRPFAFRLATPYWLLWYLASLACWRVLLPAVMSLRPGTTRRRRGGPWCSSSTAPGSVARTG